MRCVLLIYAIFVVFNKAVGLTRKEGRKSLTIERIEEKIHDYFDSPLWQEFDAIWQKHKGAIENSIRLSLQHSFGRKSANVFSHPYDQRKILFEGLYFNDNVVKLLVKNLTLREMPFMRQPDVTFNLPNNELRVDAALSTVFIEAEYVVFRNRSSLVFTNHLDPQTQSPFTSSEVHTSGMVTIVANECTLNGNVLTALSSSLVILLQDFFKVQNCRFYVEVTTVGTVGNHAMVYTCRTLVQPAEFNLTAARIPLAPSIGMFWQIYRPDSGSPPVIAPYFSLSQGNIIERILTPTIKKELMANLQGALTATVNTSAIFSSELLPKIRNANRNVFKKTTAYLQKVVSSINRHTREHTEGVVHLEPLHITWDDNDGAQQMNKFSLENMTLYGMDTAYSSSLGGPYKNVYTRASDHFRFSTLQVRGQVMMSNNSTEGTPKKCDFTLVMRDFGIDTQLNCDFGRRAASRREEPKPTKGVNIFEVLGWRAAEFSIMNPGTGRFASNSLAVGYLNEQVPEKLIDLFTVYEQAVKTADDPENNQSINKLPANGFEKQLNPDDREYVDNKHLEDFKLAADENKGKVNEDNLPPNPNQGKANENNLPLNEVESLKPEDLRTFQVLKSKLSRDDPLKRDLAYHLKDNPAKNAVLKAAEKVF